MVVFLTILLINVPTINIANAPIIIEIQSFNNKGVVLRVIDPNDAFTTYRVAVPTKYIKDTPGQLDYDEYWDIFAKGTNIVDTETYIYDAVVNTIKNESPINISEVSSCSDTGNRLVITHQ